MTATMLRFFNDTVQVNPANIYITNIKLYEASKTSESSKEYFYVRNAQSDIIGLVNGAGDQVVSYVYDTWGKLVSISGNLAGSIGELNPYRYRGYRYDSETGLYYLQSRYYNPEWGRFINADAIGGQVGELMSHNIFAYCKNNPANTEDQSGYYGTDLEGVKIYTRASAKGYEFMKQIYEAYPGFAKNTESFTTSFGSRIPDFINKKVVGEIKNVKYQHFSSQIKGFMEIARKEGKKFVLVIEEGTRLSKPLVKAISRSGGEIIKVASKKVIMPFFFSNEQLENLMIQLDPNAVY